MKLYMHPASTTSRPVMQFIADAKLDVEQQVVDIFQGRASRRGLRQAQSEPAHPASRGRRFPPQRERDDPALSRREVRLARLSQGSEAPRQGRRAARLVQFEFLSRLGLRDGLSAGVSRN